jgi:hypothetical protein
MPEYNDWPSWEDEDRYWRTNYRTRPYASTGSSDYDFYRPAYQYGYEGAKQYQGRGWDDVESDLSRSWTSYKYRGESTWEQVKDAVRDAWDRMTGNRTVSTR